MRLDDRVSDRLNADQLARAAKPVVEATEQYLRDLDFDSPGFVLTDVMLICVRRGYDENGSKSITNILSPTDSAVTMMLGMLEHGKIRLIQVLNEDSEGDE